MQNDQNEFSPDQPTDAEIYREAEEFRHVDPSGAGPWRFRVVVYDTVGEGLKVRSGNQLQADVVGMANDYADVWVECQQDTEFDPMISDRIPGRWLRIKWPNLISSNQIYYSSVNDSHSAWVYAGYTVPSGHSGEVPSVA